MEPAAEFYRDSARSNPENQNRNVDIRHSSRLEVPNKLLEIGYASAHLLNEGLHGHDFDPSVNVAEIMEDRHFGTYAIDYE